MMFLFKRQNGKQGNYYMVVLKFTFSVGSQIFFLLVGEKQSYRLYHVKFWDDPLLFYLQKEVFLFLELDVHLQVTQTC